MAVACLAACVHCTLLWLQPAPARTHCPPAYPPAADIAAVSTGGRANGRWKPDNQDSFLVQPTAGGPASEEPRAAAIGVFDGHGRLGASAAAIVRQAMADRLAALRAEEAAAAVADGVQGAAALLDGCFTAAEAAMQSSGRDFSKSGCTAVLALLDRDRCGAGAAPPQPARPAAA